MELVLGNQTSATYILPHHNILISSISPTPFFTFSNSDAILTMTVPKPPTRILILGSGVVGSSLAHVLSTSSLPPSTTIQVLSPPLTTLTTSTSLAPGLVGQLNALPALTTLAKASVKAYLTLPPGAFSQAGGLEIASSAEGIKILEERLEKAREAGLEARLVDSEEIAKLSPQFHVKDGVSRGLYFPTDGVAEPSRIVEAYQASARANGVEFIEAIALGIKHLNGVVKGINTSAGFISADKIIVASGIWSAELLKDILHIPVIPVGHPYLHGAPRPERGEKSPFVRWPEKGVYGRDHGACEGFGTYDHAPLPVAAAEGAEKGWAPEFDSAVERALGLFPSETRQAMTADGSRKFNGVFAVTPDGLPVVGPVGDINGLWVAAGVWVTHAMGVAGLVAKMVLKEEREVEVSSGGEGSEVVEEVVVVDEEFEELKRVLNPGRFGGRGVEELRREAGGRYNDIYNLEE
ncbi:hypothetical protein VE01_07810 [Pseudogymnoascus verrucosus]|uniref:FAD dependent oxidoreductase domain-containing protein n=1 Tax=Pseudogymnoascus verrucosus TaxID=342668 RepID=A0A1B8GEN9_9PEZI|nr:uncharacterized protein VE01_07810 [Pseudogymnoascus verrucosus]OBT94287.2 hypothetical protein VE01_07810 [Pseudogymnoascus verrucosus]